MPFISGAEKEVQQEFKRLKQGLQPINLTTELHSKCSVCTFTGYSVLHSSRKRGPDGTVVLVEDDSTKRRSSKGFIIFPMIQ